MKICGTTSHADGLSRQTMTMRVRYLLILSNAVLAALLFGEMQSLAQEPKERATLTGHTVAIRSMAFSPDGKTLASGSWDWTARLWDVTTGKERATLRHDYHVTCVAFTPDGKTLASGSKDARRLKKRKGVGSLSKTGFVKRLPTRMALKRCPSVHSGKDKGLPKLPTVNSSESFKCHSLPTPFLSRPSAAAVEEVGWQVD